MIPGMRSEPDLRERQVEFLIARLALRQHVLENAVRALFTYDPPKDDAERANAIATLELSLADAEDAGKVQAFVADQQELLPVSFR